MAWSCGLSIITYLALPRIHASYKLVVVAKNSMPMTTIFAATDIFMAKMAAKCQQ